MNLNQVVPPIPSTESLDTLLNVLSFVSDPVALKTVTKKLSDDIKALKKLQESTSSDLESLKTAQRDLENRQKDVADKEAVAMSLKADYETKLAKLKTLL